MTTCLNFLNVGEFLAKTFDAQTHPAILHNAVQLSLPDDIKLPRHPPCECRKTQNSGHRNMRQETRPLMEHTNHQNPPCMKFESSCRNGTPGMSRSRDGLTTGNFGSYPQRGFSSVTLPPLPPIFETLLNTDNVSKVILEFDGFLQSTGQPRLLLLGVSHSLPAPDCPFYFRSSPFSDRLSSNFHSYLLCHPLFSRDDFVLTFSLSLFDSLSVFVSPVLDRSAVCLAR